RARSSGWRRPPRRSAPERPWALLPLDLLSGPLFFIRQEERLRSISHRLDALADCVHVSLPPAPADARRAGVPARGQRGVAGCRPSRADFSRGPDTLAPVARKRAAAGQETSHPARPF